MNTDKIELTKREKEIIVMASNDSYQVKEEDYKELKHLAFLGLGETMDGEFGQIFEFELSNKAKAYLFENPKLKNPSIFDDKKFWFELVSNII